MLSIKSIDTYYGKVQVLRGVSLEIPSQKIVTLLGANGAGKTTTMRTIMGFIVPAKGEIEFEGRRINGFAPSKIVRLGISLVPERRLIFPQMTVLENLGMGAFIRRDTRKIREDLDLVYGLFPVLQERRKQIGATLSGGEQQMLAISRAIMSKPKLLLLDEPSLGLAPLIVDQIFDTILKINQAERCTIFLVEQNARIALSISQWGYIMEVGEVVMQDESEKLQKNAEVKKAYLGGE
jgi:branched-chain amino acid transport system ATP-binding protein